MMRRQRSLFAANAESASGREDSDPRSGLVNLADIMLVFAVALMLALITHWSVDVTAAANGSKSLQPLEEESTQGEAVDESDVANGSYEEYGTIYRDIDSGELYLLEK
jgi:hypothetical protein